MRIFTITNTFSRDVKDYLVCVQTAKHDVCLPALFHWKAACVLCLDPELFRLACRSCSKHYCVMLSLHHPH